MQVEYVDGRHSRAVSRREYKLFTAGGQSQDVVVSARRPAISSWSRRSFSEAHPGRDGSTMQEGDVLPRRVRFTQDSLSDHFNCGGCGHGRSKSVASSICSTSLAVVCGRTGSILHVSREVDATHDFGMKLRGATTIH